MLKRVVYILFAFFLCPLVGQAQNLPSLEIAKEISKGSLPNGIDYYLVTNTAEKGFADFALVRKEVLYDGSDRKALSGLKHFYSRVPHKFLADNSIGYGDLGYIHHTSNSTIYSFNDVPTYDRNVSDSTLLMVMDIASESRRPQAIIISGDIDASKIKERMGLLSMMVPRLDLEAQKSSYEWSVRNKPSSGYTRNYTNQIAAIHLIYSSERPSPESLNTLQPIVSEVYANILGEIAGARIYDACSSADIPLAKIDFEYVSAAVQAHEERYYFTIYCQDEYLKEVTELTASALSGLDKDGATEAEFDAARNAVAERLKASLSSQRILNADYMKRCIYSYLYGAHLAPSSIILNYLDRRLDIATELPIFQSYASSILDGSSNVSIRFDSPRQDIDKDALCYSFTSSWPAAFFHEEKDNHIGYLRLQNPISRLKNPSEASDPVSGGKVWTFSNGIKVVYKKMSLGSEFHYSLLLNGGISSLPDLQMGEDAFVQELMELCQVAEMPWSEFQKALYRDGIIMDQAAKLSDFRYEGKAKIESLSSLLAYMQYLNQRSAPSPDALKKYKEEKALRLDMAKLYPRDLEHVMDSILHPGYRYGSVKDISCLGDALPEKIAQTLNSSFNKANDGLLVIVGNFDEAQLKKDLCRYLSVFPNQRRFAGRPKIDSNFASGSVSYTEQASQGIVGGKEIGSYMSISTLLPYNIDNYMAYKAAMIIFRDELKKALVDKGTSLELRSRYEVFPNERVTIYVESHPCPENGLPADLKPSSSLDAMATISSVTRDLSSLKIDGNKLKAIKELLQGEFAYRQTDVQLLIDDILIRYSQGRDMVTGYKNAINSLNTDKVIALLTQIAQGARVEYIINE